MQGRDAAHRQLVRRFGSLIKQISPMEAEHPLKPVWAGLPRADSNHCAVDEPPQYSHEELEVLALRKPLSELLKDAKRYVTDFGTQEHRERFSANALVEIAYFGHPGRRGYSKKDCLADLRSLKILLEEVSFRRAETHRDVTDRPSVGETVDHVTSAEQHFSVKELSERWGLSERTIRRLIDKEPGVIRIQKDSRLKRSYCRLQVPASVAERIHRKITRG